MKIKLKEAQEKQYFIDLKSFNKKYLGYGRGRWQITEWMNEETKFKCHFSSQVNDFSFYADLAKLEEKHGTLYIGKSIGKYKYHLLSIPKTEYGL